KFKRVHHADTFSMLCPAVEAGVVLLMFSPAAADSSSLNCSIIRLPTCYFRYQLAQWTDSADCDSYWEDNNNLNIISVLSALTATGSDLQW
ncbi:hypothetical protein XENOCAPTIV_006716, partial [Xenoophorus captivus]